MDSRMLLIPCFLSLFFLASHRCADVCDKEEPQTITQEDVEVFEKVRHLYDDALPKRPDVCGRDRNQSLIQLGEYYYDVCPSVTVLALFWGIPNEGYKCWIVEPVSYTNCTRCDNACLDWNHEPLNQNYRSLCKKKFVYESVCSFCVQDDTEEISFQVIEVPIPKCCTCTLIKG